MSGGLKNVPDIMTRVDQREEEGEEADVEEVKGGDVVGQVRGITWLCQRRPKL